MRLLTLIIFLGLATKAHAATYFLLSQTNTFAAGITNLAKAYTDAQIAAHGAIPGTVINTQGGAAGVPLALRDATGTNAAPFYGGEPVSTKTAAYTVLYTDNDTFFIWNSATNCIVTFNDGATNGFNVTFKNLGAGSLIITNAAGKTFDSQTSVTLPTSTISHWIADGTNYRGGRNGPNNLVSGNKVFASPSDGSSGLMIPRVLVTADLPAVTSAANWTGSGSTNSLLNGTSFQNSGIFTNSLNVTAGTIGVTNTTSDAEIYVHGLGSGSDGRLILSGFDGSQLEWQRNAVNEWRMERKSGTDDLYLLSNNGSPFTLLSTFWRYTDGHVGINTTSPGSWLTVGGDVTITPPANTTALTSTGYSLTGSSTNNMISLAGTLNTSGVVDVFKLATTVTAAGSGSKLFHLYGGAAGATTLFNMDTSGNVGIGTASPDVKVTIGSLALGAQGLSPALNISGSVAASVPGINIGQDSTHAMSLYWTGNATPGNAIAHFETAGYLNDFYLDAKTLVLQSHGGNVGIGGTDVLLVRDGAANTLAMRNSTAAQTNRLYGTFSTTADYVRLATWVNSTTVNIAAETAGTGADNIPINITPAGTSGVVIGGVSDASAAAAGKVGEVISSNIAVGSAVSLTTATAANVTSISLTAGDWRVSGNVNFAATTATVTGTSGGITVTSATVPTDGTEVYSGVQVTLLSETDSVTLPGKQINVSATTTVYLVGKSTFSAGSVAAFGSISARRIR